MAIQNASDLLVYAKTTAPAKQVTRIRVLTTDPIEVPDGGTTGTIKGNNITNAIGNITDNQSTAAVVNTGTAVLVGISGILTANGYVDSGSDVVIGSYTHREYTNAAVGLVPTLSFSDGTATLNEGAIIIEIVTPGSSAIFDPVAFSTSASFSTNMDLRDVTNKDSGGWSESLGGLKSFEVSTDILQSINPDVPLDGTDFFDKLKARSLVDLSFSDRIRNIIRTNLSQIGVDDFTGFNITQAYLQADPFGGTNASKIQVDDDSVDYNRLQYSVSATRLEDKTVTFSVYVKGVGSNTSVSFSSEKQGGAGIAPSLVEVLSGDFTSITSPTTNARAVNGLSTSSFTRISVTYNNLSATGTENINFMVFPGADPAAQTNGDMVIVSSWQIEFSPKATDYQDPTDITHWQGNALVSSVSFDAGVEDNLTCSATFTGTGNVYPNGLGPELIGDTGFDDANYWDVNDSAAGASSIVEDGYGKIITSGDYTDISKDGILTAGDTYSLTYTVNTNSGGSIGVGNVYGNGSGGSGIDLLLQSTAGQTYTVQFKANIADLIIKRMSAGVTNTIWLSSISLKKVL